MSLLSGENKKNDSKKSWLPKSWGVRFTIAVAGTVLIWSMNFYWMRSDKGCTACTTWDVTWILIQTSLIPLMGIFFLIWTFKLLWKQKFFLVQWLRLTNKQQGMFTAVFFVGTSLALGIYYATLNLAPSHAMNLYLGSYFAFLVVWISAFCWVSRQNIRLCIQPDSVATDIGGRSMAGLRRWWNVRENRLNAISIFIILLAFVTPGRLANNLVWSVGLVILCQLFLRLNQWVVALTLYGHYDWALRLGRVFSWLPGFGRSYKGWILSEASRYSDALKIFKLLAFDENGQPLLKSWDLYMYASILLRSGDKAAAQELFEASVQEQQQELKDYFHLGLADCLLAQKKDAERARELIAHVITDRELAHPSGQKGVESIHTTGFYAYAMASCGQHEEALRLLQEAMAASTEFNNRDMAALQHINGLTWQTLGDMEKAKTGFENAITLHPYGDIALRARKKLAVLAGEAED